MSVLLHIIQDYLNPLWTTNIGGRLVHERTASGMHFCVYLPPNYDPDDDTGEERYPVLYHLHGAGETYFMMRREVLWTAAKFEEADESIIIVGPWDSSKWSMWADGTNAKASTSLMDEVIPRVEETYPVRPDRSSRSIQGFSMGGFGAATHAFLHPEKFGRVILWDAALHDWETLREGRPSVATDQFGDEEENFDAWSPWKAASKLADTGRLKQTPVRMYSGTMPATNEFAERYHRHLVSLGADVEYTKTEFPHTLKRFMNGHGKEAVEFVVASGTD